MKGRYSDGPPWQRGPGPIAHLDDEPLICFRRLLEDIEADGLDAEQDGAWCVPWTSQLIICKPRRVVRLRVSAREATMEQRPCSAEQENDQRHHAGPADGLPDHHDGPF